MVFYSMLGIQGQGLVNKFYFRYFYVPFSGKIIKCIYAKGLYLSLSFNLYSVYNKNYNTVKCIWYVLVLWNIGQVSNKHSTSADLKHNSYNILCLDLYASCYHFPPCYSFWVRISSSQLDYILGRTKIHTTYRINQFFDSELIN